MKKNLLILGAGQYGSVVKEIAEEIGCYEKIDFLDDCHGKDVKGFHEETIGSLKDLESYVSEYPYAIPAVGHAEMRMQLIKTAEEYGFRIPIIISSKAYVSNSAQIEKGVVIEPLAGVHANCLIGKGSYISMGAVVNHNSIVGGGCHVDNNAVIMSGAFLKPLTTTEPCEIVRREPAIYVKNDDQFIKSPNYDESDEWVKDYIKENGHGPTFF